MSIKKYKIFTVIFAVLTLICLAMIFRFGTQNHTDSMELSDKIVEKIQDTVKTVKNTDIADTPTKWYFLSVKVRKSAHMIEFFALGVCASLFVASLFGASGKKFYFFPSTLCLAAAIASEYIQSKIDRTGVISDVVIDSCGALAGIFTVCIVLGTVMLCKKKKRSRACKKQGTDVISQS